jgi:hypothetical protein
VTEPCVSSVMYDLAVIAAILAFVAVGLLAIAARLFVKAARRFRSSRLGTELLEMCGGHYLSAQMVIADLRASDRLLDAAIRKVAPAAFKFPLWDDLQ